MASFEACKVIRAAKSDGEDCAIVVQHDQSIVIAVADGAGGTGAVARQPPTTHVRGRSI